MGESEPRPKASTQNQLATPAPQNAASRGRTAGQATRGVAQGVGGFLQPFKQVGGKIWLEVTGVFFLLPALVCAPILWRTRLSFAQGPDHRTFWAAAVVIVLFHYLGVSSFWRAQKKRGSL